MPIPVYARPYRMPDETVDKLADLFEELISEGGLLAVRDILIVLGDQTGLVGDMAREDGEAERDQRLISWGQSLINAGMKIERIIPNILRRNREC